MRTALVIGGAACVWKDIDAALDMGEFQGVVAANDVGTVWPGELDGWCSFHANKLANWAAMREGNGHPTCKRIAGHLGDGNKYPGTNAKPSAIKEYVDHLLPGQVNSGSSGLFAVKFALVDLGFDRAVICGMPMLEFHGHFFDPTKWMGAQAHRKGWNEALPYLATRARSLSGWTRELLGAPTPEFITG